MRFLIGITTGAILTLLFATAMDAPTHPMIDRTQGAVAGIWDRLISSTSDSLFTRKSLTTDPQDNPQSEISRTPSIPEEAPGIETAIPQRASALANAPALENARAPAAPLAPPRAVDTPPPAVIARPPAVASQSVDTSTDPIIPDLAFNEVDRTEAPVWVPFHSLMSAEGFAARLARELDHDFQVERRGAGTYQVVFESSDPTERAALMAQISEITGQ